MDAYQKFWAGNHSMNYQYFVFVFIVVTDRFFSNVVMFLSKLQPQSIAKAIISKILRNRVNSAESDRRVKAESCNKLSGSPGGEVC